MAVLVVANPARQQEKARPPVAASSILSRLRLETRAEHEAVEQVLDLMSDSLTRQSYRPRFEQFYGFYGFYGFYAPLENALQARVEGKPNQVGELTLSPAR